uniref:NMDA receptor synaptonuclear signaling and neuronal migration factor a n=1 Tax=Scophthalmus maximus TaxID=52904 RepID=A0A8D3EG78_SCOMX
MGTAVSKRKNLRNDAISSVAAKVRAARAFGENLSHTHSENRNGSGQRLCHPAICPPLTCCSAHSSVILPSPALPHSLLKCQAGIISVYYNSPTVAGSHSHHGSHHSHHHHHLSQPPLQTSVSAHNIRGWGEGGKGEAECSGLACDSCSGVPSRSQGSLDLESAPREAGKQHRRLERMWSVDRMTGLEREDTNWFPKENMFSFQTATTTMQASKSFNRSWSDPTPVKTDSPHEPRDSELTQMCANWEEEREMERLACEGDDFIPPKIMLISSKVPKAEYVPTIIRRDDPSIIPILYDHEHATFDDILEEIEKKLTAYRRGSKFWRMLIFCQGGPGHLYLLKNKVATFAKVEKEEDMSQFWRRLSRFMSKVNPEPNLIHIMGCYVLGNPNGEKLFQKLKNLMRPYSVEFESPLELSAQGKEMIEMYFDFRLYRLWKTRQHSKLLDYEEFL